MIESLAQLTQALGDQGASRIFAKILASNDNSKNQIYLGSGFGALNKIPHGEILVDTSNRAGSKRDRPKAAIRFFWLNEAGKHHAPDANLILYPDYPEVRMSGLLRGCRQAPNALVNSRDRGRVLILGITPSGDVLAYLAAAGSQIANQVENGGWSTHGVFIELPADISRPLDARSVLLSRLRTVSGRGWIASQKLTKGQKAPYSARNGGGYTLEAELGIQPNGYAEPDFMGWEVKQYSVTDFIKFAPKFPVTLFTPEPTGGFYKSEGATAFVERFGYPDKKHREGRRNFGGVYACGKGSHADTGLRMVLRGFDLSTGTISDIDGGMALLTADGEEAATWAFPRLIDHWNRKHAQAAYVPSISRSPPLEYAYGQRVLLCEGTDFFRFLRAFSQGVVYYDPALNLTTSIAGKSSLHRRSQFRVRHSGLKQLYESCEVVGLAP